MGKSVIIVDFTKPDFFVCEQQRRRPDCTEAQSDQRLCKPLSGKSISYYKITIS